MKLWLKISGGLTAVQWALFLTFFITTHLNAPVPFSITIYTPIELAFGAVGVLEIAALVMMYILSINKYSEETLSYFVLAGVAKCIVGVGILINLL